MTDGTDPDRQFWELALAVNAAFKGLLGSLGQSGHICAKTNFIKQVLDLEHGWDATCRTIAKLLRGRLNDGDVVVIADKIVAVAQRRFGPPVVLSDPDPKTVDPSLLSKLAAKYELELGFPVSPLHLLLADEYQGDKVTLGALDHNQAAWDLANRICSECGRVVDVVISDTDTGLDVKYPLIGCVTIAATPLGASAGLTLYEAMRCAVAAEFVRGHTKNIPIVICEPAERRRWRSDMGQARAYQGALHISKETGVTYI